jgi:lipopolysaccharide export system permease protein
MMCAVSIKKPDTSGRNQSLFLFFKTHFPQPGQLDRYLLHQLLMALLAATGALVALIWLTQSLRFVELVVGRGLSPWAFLGLTGLLVPSFVAVILPITTFVVVQFVYQRLAGDRELTVMRAAGLSPFALSRPALMLAGLSMLCCFLLNMWIVPHSYGAFRADQFEIRNRMAAFLLQEGVFTPISDSMTVYVRTRDPDGLLHGIMVDDARQPNSHATVLAETGRLVSDASGPHVLLYHGSRQALDRQTGRLNVLTFTENLLDLTGNGREDQQRFRDATEMSISELLNPDLKDVSARDRPKFRVEAHRRLAAPFSAVSFALVGLTSVLTGGFRRHGGILRPLIGVMTVVALVLAGLAAQDLASVHPALIPMIWLQALLPGLVCAWCLFVPETWHQSWQQPWHRRPA